MANAPSESDRQYNEDLINEKAREIFKGEKGTAEVDELINKVLEKSFLHHKHRERFRKDVLKRVSEMKEKSKGDRENKIIDEYEGKLQVIDGKMRPSGVQEDFKMHVWAGKFEVGNIGRKIWGHSVDADKLAEILDGVKKLEEDIEQNKVELEMLKAARNATATIIGSDKLGLSFGVTKSSLVKDIYKNKLKSKGWSSVFSTELNLWESYKAAKDLKEKHEEEYNDESAGGKAKIKKIEMRERSLAQKKAILEAALKKIEKLRENGRNLFKSAFGEQLQVLLKNRDVMDEADYNKHVDGLYKKVGEFGKSAGIVNMGFFLDEALGVKPGVRRPGEAVIYKEPRTTVEKSEERVKIGRMWKVIFDKDCSEGDTTAFLEALRKNDPAFLKEFVANKPSDETLMAANVLRFLFLGKIPAKGANEVLSSTRRADLSVENVLKYLNIAKEVAKEYKGKEGELTDIMETYAKKWPSEYKAEDFGYVYKSIPKETGKNDVANKHVAEVSAVWEKLTGATISTASEAEDISNALKEAYADDSLGVDVAMERMSKKPESQIMFVNFLFTGKFFDETLVADKGLCYGVGSANFVKVYKLVDKLFSDHKLDKEKLSKLIKKITEKDGVLKTKGGLDQFTEEELSNLIIETGGKKDGKKK